MLVDRHRLLLADEIRNVSRLFKEVLSTYLYGSALRDDYRIDDSDIDVLMIVTNDAPFEVLAKLQERCRSLHEAIDLNIIYQYEYLRRIHPGWSSHYYYNVKMTGVLVHGENLLDTVDEYEFSYAEAQKRLVQLTQRARFVVMNIKKESEIKFWLQKYQHWVPLCLMEFLFLYGTPEYQLHSAHETFNRVFTLSCDVPKYPYVSFTKLHQYLEKLAVWIYQNEGCFRQSINQPQVISLYENQ